MFLMFKVDVMDGRPSSLGDRYVKPHNSKQMPLGLKLSPGPSLGRESPLTSPCSRVTHKADPDTALTAFRNTDEELAALTLHRKPYPQTPIAKMPLRSISSLAFMECTPSNPAFLTTGLQAAP